MSAVVSFYVVITVCYLGIIVVHGVNAPNEEVQKQVLQELEALKEKLEQLNEAAVPNPEHNHASDKDVEGKSPAKVSG